MEVSNKKLPPKVFSLIKRWGTIWGLQDLEKTVHISFSSNLRRAIGQCKPSRDRITLHTDLLSVQKKYLPEVLCHEMAHVAAYRLFGRMSHPHGEDWKQLILMVGFLPKVRKVIANLENNNKPSDIHPPLWKHRCPVCHTLKIARRPMRNWRCSECTEAGLDGILIVSRQETTKGIS
jgi:predicted SprT family Zn-dependent metalloprotease